MRTLRMTETARSWRSRRVGAAGSLVLALLAARGAFATPSVTVTNQSTINFPGPIDSTSPGFWSGTTAILITSTSGAPNYSSGVDLFHQSAPKYAPALPGAWIESVYKDASGRLYGWYHQEQGLLCGADGLHVPHIGAAYSDNDGQYWNDMGIIMSGPSYNCSSADEFFAGGEGDFVVVLDQINQYFYFYITSYHTTFAEQGIAVARMPFGSRASPIGAVSKWCNGGWNCAGIGGSVSPIYPAAGDWHSTTHN